MYSASWSVRHPLLWEDHPRRIHPVGLSERVVTLRVRHLVERWVFLAVVLLKVLGWDEALPTVFTLILGLHHVDLWLGVAVQVRLCHALVVAQTAVELSDTLVAHHVHLELTVSACEVVAEATLVRTDILVEVHVSVDVGQGREVFVAVGAAVDGATVRQQGRLTHLLPPQGWHDYIQPRMGSWERRSSWMSSAQPASHLIIVSIKVIKVEAKLRWTHAVRGRGCRVGLEGVAARGKYWWYGAGISRHRECRHWVANIVHHTTGGDRWTDQSNRRLTTRPWRPVVHCLRVDTDGWVVWWHRPTSWGQQLALGRLHLWVGKDRLDRCGHDLITGRHWWLHIRTVLLGATALLHHPRQGPVVNPRLWHIDII